MKLIKTTGLIAAAFGLVALFSAEAGAQAAPTMTVNVSGASVDISWTAVPGATGYTIQAGSSPEVANIASVNLPASITRIVVQAPPGRYYMRVRAFAGSQSTPYSNVVEVNVGGSPGPGPGPCQQPSAPQVTATTQGLTVHISWTGGEGTVGFRLEFSRTPGTTELVETVGPSQRSYSRYVGMLGTFYVRVVAGNACGLSRSTEVSFTTTNTGGGGGPRTPDPPPGQLLPRPNMAGVVQQVANQYPVAFRRSRPTDCGGNHEFMYRLVQELRRHDSRWGLNWKRGWAGSMSEDIVTYNPTNRPDNGESQVYLFDIIGGACGGEVVVWNDVTNVTWANRGQPYCGTEWCAGWTLDPYLRAGFPPDPRPEQ